MSVDERDDLAEVWGEPEQRAYEQAQAHNVDAIVSFVNPRGRNAQPPAPMAPTVPLYRHYDAVHGTYINEKVAPYERLLQVDAEQPVGDDDEEEYEERDAEGEMLQMLDQGTKRRRNPRTPDARRENGKRVRQSDESSSASDSDSQGVARRPCSTHTLEPTHGWCFLCGWGDRFHDGIEAPKANRLAQIIRQNHGICDNIEIAQQLHLYFMEHIYEEGSGMPILTIATALEHIEGLHSLDASMFLGESIRDEKRITFLLKNRIFREDGSYDEKALTHYWRSVYNQRQLYNQRVAMMNFNNSVTREDLQRQANYFNLQQPYTQRAERQRAQERVDKTRRMAPFKWS